MSPKDANSYEARTYQEISEEFIRLYPSVVRAFQLIPMMYNRLTLIDRMPHKEALKKIYEDHRELPGFSPRNVQRYLPADNPNIPHRVTARRHKDSHTVPPIKYSLSSTEKGKIIESKDSSDELCPNCPLFKMRIDELEQALSASAGPTPAASFAPQIQRFTVPKERHTELIDSMEKSIEVIYLEFDKNGTYLSPLTDSHYKKIYERDEKQTV